jgi:hypothetical protein
MVASLKVEKLTEQLKREARRLRPEPRQKNGRKLDAGPRQK